jgi:hypothetical protein
MILWRLVRNRSRITNQVLHVSGSTSRKLTNKTISVSTPCLSTRVMNGKSNKVKILKIPNPSPETKPKSSASLRLLPSKIKKY